MFLLLNNSQVLQAPSHPPSQTLSSDTQFVNPSVLLTLRKTISTIVLGSVLYSHFSKYFCAFSNQHKPSKSLQMVSLVPKVQKTPKLTVISTTREVFKCLLFRVQGRRRAILSQDPWESTLVSQQIIYIFSFSSVEIINLCIISHNI